MNAISENSVCPRCGGSVPSDAPGGQCPQCLLEAVAAADPPTAPAMPGEWPTLDEVRAAFPDLEVDSEIGRGGMAVVYKARQVHLDRMVALKVLAPWLAAEAGFSERFSREARVLAKLNHPNIVTIHDFGQASRFFYLLMEFMDGVNLRQAMQAGRFAPAQALALVPRICDALQYAHGEGVLHRDIKPDNILLDSRGRVKIADFGIAKLAGEPEPMVPLTRSGMRLGTPAYMAPEQVEKPGDVDHRADIYSLGVVLYEMLTGELPLGRFAAPSEKASVDARIDEIVFRTLEKERERRYQSAEEVKTRVEGLGGPPPPPPLPGVTGEPRPIGAVPAPGTTHPPGLTDPLSHKAVAGAVATGLSVCGLFVLVPTWSMPVMRVSHGPVDPSPGGASVFLPIFLFIVLGGLAVFTLGGIVLGASGLSDIHRCGGRRRGAGLAAFAAFSWPFLILIGVSAGLSALLSEALFNGGEGPVSGREWLKPMVMVAGIGGALWFGVSLIRRVLRWARCEGPVAAPAATAASLTSAATVAGVDPGAARVIPEKTSGLALAGGILSLISLMPAVLLAVLLWSTLTAGVGATMPGLGGLEIVIIIFVCGFPGMIGFVLGIAAMRAIRDSGGRLGGVGWAVLGGMGWPVMMLFVLGAVLAVPVSHAIPGPLGHALGLTCALVLPALLARKVFRSAASWTRGARFSAPLTAGDWWVLGMGALALLAAAGLSAFRTQGMRGGQDHGKPMPMAGSSRVDSRPVPMIGAGSDLPADVLVTQAELRAELRPDVTGPAVHRLDLAVTATLPAHGRLESAYWTRSAAGDGTTVARTVNESTLIIGDVFGGVATFQHQIRLLLPEGITEAAAQEAQRQIINGWLNQKHSLRLDRPERLFEIDGPEGSRFEAVIVLKSTRAQD